MRIAEVGDVMWRIFEDCLAYIRSHIVGISAILDTLHRLVLNSINVDFVLTCFYLYLRCSAFSIVW